MKKVFCIIFAAALCALSTVTAVGAGGSFSWYCKRQKDHIRPTAEGNMSFIEKYDGAYIGKNPDEKVVYLTFDAGYENGNVARVLDALKKHNAKGAFFILDNLAKRNGELVKRMESDGHFVCNHTARHKDMTKLSKEEFIEEYVKAKNKQHTLKDYDLYVENAAIVRAFEAQIAFMTIYERGYRYDSNKNMIVKRE